LHLLDGMGQFQGATTSATAYDIPKTPITYDIPHTGRCPTSRKLILSGRRLPLDGLSQAELGRGTGRQRGSHGQRVTWASVRPSVRPSVHPSVRPGPSLGFTLYALCAEEGQFLRFEQNVGRFLRFTNIWMK
jgi:hypothetical protein